MNVGAIDVEVIGFVLFHAVSLQAVTAGMIAGDLRTGSLLTSAKYVLVLLMIALVSWG